MAKGMVKMFVVGNLGKDPEVRFGASGTAVCNLRVASGIRVKNGDKWEDATEWTDVVCFGKTAENAGQHLKKGDRVIVDGEKRTREWTDKEGGKRYSVECIADDVVFGGGAGGGKHESAAPKGDDIPF